MPGCWIYLWDTVLGALRHRVGHWQVVHHHDVLVGLVHGSRGLRSGTDGGAAVLDGGSWRLDLRPLKKLGEGRERGEKTKNRSDVLGKNWKYPYNIILMVLVSKGCHTSRKLQDSPCFSGNSRAVYGFLFYKAETGKKLYKLIIISLYLLNFTVEPSEQTLEK